MAFHTDHRPRTLETLIGHTAVVTRLQGIVASKKYPSAIMFAGPTSAGKTTLARAFAAGVNGIEGPVENHPDYREVNVGSERSVDTVRELIANSKFKPRTNKRIIVLDEVQAILGTPASCDAILKPLEEPSKDTIWILCTMDPDKFKNGKGKSIANRCTQFLLEPHTSSDLLKQAIRIAKAEKMGYVMDEERTLLKEIVRGSNGEMRTLSNQMEAAQQFYEGLKDKPKKLSMENITAVLSSTETSDDKTAALVLEAVYRGQYAVVHRSLLDVNEGFIFINKLMAMNGFLLASAVLNGKRHPKAWSTPAGYALQKKVKDVTLGTLAATNAALSEVRSQAAALQMSSEELLSAKLYRLIKEIHSK